MSLSYLFLFPSGDGDAFYSLIHHLPTPPIGESKFIRWAKQDKRVNRKKIFNILFLIAVLPKMLLTFSPHFSPYCYSLIALFWIKLKVYINIHTKEKSFDKLVILAKTGKAIKSKGQASLSIDPRVWVEISAINIILL